jgi:60 kDa SS-A/Ro ribonucleoprotein
MRYSKAINKTDQKTQAKSNQVKNNAGGYVFDAGIWTTLERFLVLGSESPTYYVGKQKLTMSNSMNLINCLKADFLKTVDTIKDFAANNRAIKNDTLIFALAMAIKNAANPEQKNYAFNALNDVCRIGTHILQFVNALNDIDAGWGRSNSRHIAKWYTDKDVDNLAYQLVKYQTRESISHRDVLRLCHARPNDAVQNAIFRYVATEGKDFSKRSVDRKKEGTRIYDSLKKSDLPSIISAFEESKKIGAQYEKASTKEKNALAKKIVALIENYNLPRECIPTSMLNDTNIWEALMYKMSGVALLRNLNKLAELELTKTFSDGEKFVAEKLTNADFIKKSRLHPFQVYWGRKTYSSGKGFRGSKTWTPSVKINDALEDAFSLSFGNLEKSDKNVMIAADVSGSMGWGFIANSNITPAEASAALIYIFLKQYKNVIVGAFSGSFTLTKITSKQSIEAVAKTLASIPMGGTDCSLPMVYAKKAKLDVDSFITLTDSETWSGNIHPFQALKSFRAAQQKPLAKNVVVGMVANNFSIADPSDHGMLDVVGFDAGCPNLISDFINS